MDTLQIRYVFMLSLVAPFLFCHVVSFQHSHPGSLQLRTRSDLLVGDDSFSKFSSSSHAQVPNLTGNPIDRHESRTILSVHTRIESEPTKGTAASYHLLWTRGFAIKFAVVTFALALGHRFAYGSAGPPNFATALRGSLPSVGLSLLASSCCLLQIIANVFAGTVGCLGLNTALGPSRPYWLAVLCYLTFVRSSTNLPQILLRFSIAFLPEMLHAWNNRHKFLNEQKNTIDSGMIATLEFDVPTMGCVACINKIDSTLRNRRDENIVDVSSWLDPSLPKGGATKVTLTVKSKEEAEAISRSLLERFDSIGFGGSSVAKVEVTTESPRGKEG